MSFYAYEESNALSNGKHIAAEYGSNDFMQFRDRDKLRLFYFAFKSNEARRQWIAENPAHRGFADPQTDPLLAEKLRLDHEACEARLLGEPWAARTYFVKEMP